MPPLFHLHTLEDRGKASTHSLGVQAGRAKQGVSDPFMLELLRLAMQKCLRATNEGGALIYRHLRFTFKLSVSKLSEDMHYITVRD